MIFRLKTKRTLFTEREKKREEEREQVSGNGSGGSSSKETLTSGRNEFTFIGGWQAGSGSQNSSFDTTRGCLEIFATWDSWFLVVDHKDYAWRASRNRPWDPCKCCKRRPGWKFSRPVPISTASRVEITQHTGGIMEYAYLVGFHECLVKFISFVSIPKLRILSAVLSQISIAKRYLPSRFRSSVLHSKIKFLNWLSLFQMKNYRSIIIVSYRARDFNTFIHWFFSQCIRYIRDKNRNSSWRILIFNK